MKMTSNGKTLNYKVVELVKSYNFHIKFTPSNKKLQIFENKLNPYRRGPLRLQMLQYRAGT
jgi:hypothetical protein